MIFLAILVNFLWIFVVFLSCPAQVYCSCELLTILIMIYERKPALETCCASGNEVAPVFMHLSRNEATSCLRHLYKGEVMSQV